MSGRGMTGSNLMSAASVDADYPSDGPEWEEAVAPHPAVAPAKKVPLPCPVGDIVGNIPNRAAPISTYPLSPPLHEDIVSYASSQPSASPPLNWSRARTPSFYLEPSLPSPSHTSPLSEPSPFRDTTHESSLLRLAELLANPSLDISNPAPFLESQEPSDVHLSETDCVPSPASPATRSNASQPAGTDLGVHPKLHGTGSITAEWEYVQREGGAISRFLPCADINHTVVDDGANVVARESTSAFVVARRSMIVLQAHSCWLKQTTPAQNLFTREMLGQHPKGTTQASRVTGRARQLDRLKPPIPEIWMSESACFGRTVPMPWLRATEVQSQGLETVIEKKSRSERSEVLTDPSTHTPPSAFTLDPHSLDPRRPSPLPPHGPTAAGPIEDSGRDAEGPQGVDARGKTNDRRA
ncbi:hypothetical protein BDK51DRAFT_43186 [Blyttiomyces helicus]|uniref:Uncharacterized protein n=1 Tax=Blyttiomyces helicus TaxID=388810 RepID=A0A4V1IQL8_9FUNG|nr:hypothetical protein BDK51DRAFT_43186 [Blyttiomyces helicus]|eukprot:RKO87007.1 hypothetical protein BDK51DRAFT_43186 [Blyttiomyces helicus]